MNILFDLDGTLTDPREGITRCVQAALEAMGAPVPSQTALEVFIGPPLRRSFATLLGTSEPAAIERALELYRARYRTDGMYENRVYDGVAGMLELLHGSHRLFVATSKPRVFAEEILRHFMLARHFDSIHGSELDGTRDDKGELIRHLLAVESLAADESVMIGDRLHDIAGARANGCRSVGATWGYGSEAELREAGAGVLCHSPADVPDAVHRALTTP